MSSLNRGFPQRKPKVEEAKDLAADVLAKIGGPLGALLVAAGALVGLLVSTLAIFVLTWAIGGLIFLVGWNLGIVGVLAACGVKVGTVGYGTAFGASAALGSIKRILNSIGRFQGVNASGSAK